MGANLQSITVPPLPESSPTAAVKEVHKKIASEVRKGDAVLSIETAKLVMDLYAPCDGVILALAHEGQDNLVEGDAVAEIEERTFEKIVDKVMVLNGYEPAKTGYKPVWEGFVAQPKSNPARRFYTDEDVRAKAQELFDQTAPTKVVISLDRCTDATVAYFTAWAKRTLDQ